MNKVRYKMIIACIITITVASGFILINTVQFDNKDTARSNNAAVDIEINELQLRNDTNNLDISPQKNNDSTYQIFVGDKNHTGFGFESNTPLQYQYINSTIKNDSKNDTYEIYVDGGGCLFPRNPPTEDDIAKCKQLQEVLRKS